MTSVIASRRIPFELSNDYAHSRIMFPVGERALSWTGRDGRPNDIDDHKCLVRLSPDGKSAQPLALVSRSYKLVHNRELFGMVANTMAAQFTEQQLAEAYCVDRLSQGGRTCWREYVFPKLSYPIGGMGEAVALRIIVQNGYGGSALKLYAGAIDFFCTNGMIRGEFESVYRRHTTGLQIPALERHLAEATHTFERACHQWEQWTKQPVTREETMDFFRAVATSPQLFDRLGEQWLEETEVRGRTLWSVYSALTYYSSHVNERFTSRADEDGLDGVLQRREMRVAQWVQGDAWNKLVEATT